MHLKTADPPPLGFSTKATAGRVAAAQGKCWENLQKSGSNIVPSPSPTSTQSYKAVKQVAPPWQLPKALPHTNYRYLFYNRPHC